MDSAKLNDWIQAVGIFAVVASLIFVGLQMQLDRDIALAATYQSRTETTVAAWIERASSVEAMRGELLGRGRNPDDPVPKEFFRVLGDGEQPTWLEYQAARLTHGAEWFLWDNTHFQYQQGYLPESHWIRIRNVIKNGMKNRPFIKETWRGGSSRHEFRLTVEQIIAEIEAEDST